MFEISQTDSDQAEKCRLKGSVTIEASLIFGIILVIIATLLYYAVYLHDRAAAYETTIYMKERFRSYIKEAQDQSGHLDIADDTGTGLFQFISRTGEKKYDRMEMEYCGYMKARLLLSDIEKVSIDANERNIRISYRISFRWPVGKLFRNLTENMGITENEIILTGEVLPEAVVRVGRGIIWRK